MTRVAVLGAGGRMGQEVCRAIREAPDLELVAMVDPNLPSGPLVGVGSAAAGARAAAGAGAGGATGTGARTGAGSVSGTSSGSGSETTTVEGPVSSAAIDILDDVGAEVAVDFTDARAARVNLAWLADHGVHAVVGTTGLGADDLAELARRFDGTRANAVVAPNFAIGAVLLMRLCELAAPHMEGVEVVELHHDRKVDAPSGTALRTAERIAAARQAAGSPPLPPDPTTDEVLAGARGGEGAGGVRVHSVRLPGLVAHEEVVFGAAGQSLTIRHDSYDRRSFMPGVLLAVRAVGSRPGLTVGLESILGL